MVFLWSCVKCVFSGFCGFLIFGHVHGFLGVCECVFLCRCARLGKSGIFVGVFTGFLKMCVLEVCWFLG